MRAPNRHDEPPAAARCALVVPLLVSPPKPWLLAAATTQSGR
jgi:hypothetical protein